MTQLSNSQRKIVEAPIYEAIQVLASAGSGKTRVLTERIRFLLENTKKDNVIAITFTNKAAEEMKNRLNDYYQAEDRTWITTIHSIAQRMVEQYGHTIGLPENLHIYDRNKDRMEVFLQSLRDDSVDIDEYLNIADVQMQKSREQILQSFMEVFSIIKRELLSEEEVDKRFPDSTSLWNRFQDYQSALISSGGIDYDDLLVYAYKLLRKHDWIANIYRSKYKHLCVDEAQDLNCVQYEFIKALCGDSIKSVLLVGDPNQMIYGFNGSSSEYLCNQFVRDFSAKPYVLKKNYRSTIKIIDAANSLKPESQKENECALEGIVHIESFGNEVEEARWIASTVNQLLELEQHEEIEGKITLANMVVIARNRFAFSSLENILTEMSIPFRLRKTGRSSEPSSLFGKILDYGIRIKLNPKDWIDGKKVCSFLGLNAPKKWGASNVLEEWSKEVAHSNISHAALYSDLLLALHNLNPAEPNSNKLSNSFRDKLNKLAGSESIDKLELERSMEELEEFRKKWVRLKKKGLGHSLRAFQNASTLGQLTEDSSLNGLLLSTVHTMKGLERDIVFVISMCEGVFPDYRANSTKELNEERNNAVVAVTRAKRWLYLTYPQRRTMPWGDIRNQVESRFLKEIRQ